MSPSPGGQASRASSPLCAPAQGGPSRSALSWGYWAPVSGWEHPLDCARTGTG